MEVEGVHRLLQRMAWVAVAVVPAGLAGSSEEEEEEVLQV